MVSLKSNVFLALHWPQRVSVLLWLRYINFFLKSFPIGSYLFHIYVWFGHLCSWILFSCNILSHFIIVVCYLVLSWSWKVELLRILCYAYMSLISFLILFFIIDWLLWIWVDSAGTPQAYIGTQVWQPCVLLMSCWYLHHWIIRCSSIFFCRLLIRTLSLFAFMILQDLWWYQVM